MPVEHVIRVGPIAVAGTPASARITMAGTSFERGVTWFDAPMVEGADLVIGPQALPFDHVRQQAPAGGVVLPGGRRR